MARLKPGPDEAKAFEGDGEAKALPPGRFEQTSAAEAVLLLRVCGGAEAPPFPFCPLESSVSARKWRRTQNLCGMTTKRQWE